MRSNIIAVLATMKHFGAATSKTICIMAVGMMLIFPLSMTSYGANKKDEIMTAAENGDSDAQFLIGKCFMGNSYSISPDDFSSVSDYVELKRDDVESAKWFRKAALQGNVKAQLTMAVFCAEGIGVERSYNEAIKWYRLACNKYGETNIRKVRELREKDDDDQIYDYGLDWIHNINANKILYRLIYSSFKGREGRGDALIIDPQKLFNAYSKNPPPLKSEYETKNAYYNRLEKWSNKPIIGKISLRSLIAFEPIIHKDSPEIFKYDAENQKMCVSYLDDLILWKEYFVNPYSKHIDSRYGYLRLDRPLFSFSFPVSPAKAPIVKNHAKIIITGRIASIYNNWNNSEHIFVVPVDVSGFNLLVIDINGSILYDHNKDFNEKAIEQAMLIRKEDEKSMGK